MILTLEISGPEAAKLGAASRKVFNGGGGTIGRLTDNDWVLPDRYVSARHARIDYDNGVYYLVDESTNGVCINSPENHLVNGRPYALNSGDWILIDPYEIRVSIAAEAVALAGVLPSGRPLDTPPQRIFSSGSDPFARDDPFEDPKVPAAGHALPPDAASPRPVSEPLPGEEVDPLNLLGLESKRPAARRAPQAADLAAAPVLTDHYRAPLIPAADPAPRPGAGLIPDDYDPLVSDDRGAPAPLSVIPPRPVLQPPVRAAARVPAEMPHVSESVPPRVRPVPPSSPASARQIRDDAVPPGAAAGREEGNLADVLAGAGLEGVPVTPELARTFGQILRVVVGGVMDVLQARQRVKDEFRMGVTTFRRLDNNPLKFSANVEDALHNLLVKRNAAYLGPVDAFEDAFDDLRHHQMATLAGMRMAFEAMVAEFQPDRLQEGFDRQLKQAGGLIPMPAKLRYWELYRDRLHEMAKDPEASFHELFGSVFTRAYEEQLARLKREGKGRKR